MHHCELQVQHHMHEVSLLQSTLPRRHHSLSVPDGCPHSPAIHKHPLEGKGHSNWHANCCSRVTSKPAGCPQALGAREVVERHSERVEQQAQVAQGQVAPLRRAVVPPHAAQHLCSTPPLMDTAARSPFPVQGAARAGSPGHIAGRLALFVRILAALLGLLQVKGYSSASVFRSQSHVRPHCAQVVACGDARPCGKISLSQHMAVRSLRGGARTMQMEPPTASPMPANFCADPASRCSATAIAAVNTGMVGCMHVATTTPDRSMPMM